MSANVERIENEVWFHAASAVALAGWTDLDGEGVAGVSNGRRMRVSAVQYSAAGASSFAVRATDGTTNIPIYPASTDFDLRQVGDGVRGVDTEIRTLDLMPGFRLQWMRPDGGAIASQVSVRTHRLTHPGPGVQQ